MQPHKPSIFILEDSSTLLDIMEGSFSGDGYTVFTASSLLEFRNKLPNTNPDIFLIDLVLPDGDGLSLIADIRKQSDVPVIIISGKNDMVDKVVGLEMGADDYVGKPLQIKEVLARVKAHIRRYQSLKAGSAGESNTVRKTDGKRIQFGTWVLDREKFQAFDNTGHSAGLTAKEFRLLETLVLGAGRVFSREQLLDIARDGDYNTTDRAVDVQILRIRKKMKQNPDDPEVIESVRGIGYTLTQDTEILE